MTGSLRTEARRRERALVELEDEIHRQEDKLARLEHDLQTASHDQDLEKIQQLSREYTRTQTILDESMEEWAELAEA